MNAAINTFLLKMFAFVGKSSLLDGGTGTETETNPNQGFFDNVGKWFSDLFDSLKKLPDTIFAPIGDFFVTVFYTLLQLLYYVFGCVIMIIDVAQLLIRKLVGLDPYWLDGVRVVDPSGQSATRSGDLVLQIVRKVFLNDEYSILKITFYSLMILGAILLVITTIAAIIRNEYTPDKEKKNSKAGIVKDFLKALASFFVVPLACYFGMWLGNVVLYAIDSATSSANSAIANLPNTVVSQLDSTEGSYTYYSFFGQYNASSSTPLSGIATKAALYNSNKFRRNKEDFYKDASDVNHSFYEVVLMDTSTGVSRNFGIFNQFDKTEQGRLLAAQACDDLFMMNAKLKNPQTLDKEVLGKNTGWFTTATTVEHFDRYNAGIVSCYYDLLYYNWFVIILFGLMAGKYMLDITISVIMRLLYLLGMLFINPIVCSFMPIDGGASMSTWRKQFVVQFISVYVIIFTFNIFYLIYPIVNSISFFGYGATIPETSAAVALGTSTLMATNTNFAHGFVDFIFQLFFLVAGMQSIAQMTELFERILGRDDKNSMMAQAGNVNKALFDKKEGIVTNVAKGTMKAAGLVGKGAGFLAGAGVSILGQKVQADGDRRDRKAQRLQREQMNDPNLQGRSNRTNAQIRDDAKTATQGSAEYTRLHGQGVDQAYQDYQNSGGKLSREQWQDRDALKGEGSAYAAAQGWEDHKGDAEYQGRGGWMKYMRDQYKETGQDPKNFNEWLKTRTNVMDDEAQGREDERAARARVTAEMETEIDAALASGSSNSEIGRVALRNYNDGVTDRETARREVDIHQAEIDRLEQRRRDRRNGAGIGQSIRRAGRGIRGAFRGSPRR